MIQTFWNVLAALPAPGGGLDESHPVVPLALASLARALQARAGGLAGGLTRLCDIGGDGRHQERCLSQLIEVVGGERGVMGCFALQRDCKRRDS